MIPITLLTLLDISNPQKLGIMLISILLFPVVIGPFSRPKHSELLAMTAAYAAVLVVFVGNFAELSQANNSTIAALKPHRNVAMLNESPLDSHSFQNIISRS